MRYIKLSQESKIISIRYGQSIVDGEIQSDEGELGQVRQTDGTFFTPEPVPVEPTKSLDEQILELKEKQVTTNRLVSESGTAQQDLLELLIDMGVI